MLHPKIALFKPFNLLIEHNQHFQTLAANIFYQFAIHTLNISIGIAWNENELYSSIRLITI